MPLSTQNIESELSYVYLHAVASKAGMNCKIGNRHNDNAGIDAILNYLGPIPESYLSDIQSNIQLKATTQERTDNILKADQWLKDNFLLHSKICIRL